MSAEEILKAIPHRSPFLLIDEIIEIKDNKISTSKTFLSDEYFFKGHYPNNPLVPGVLLCECMFQSGAVLLAHLFNEDYQGIPVVTRLNNVKFKKMILPEEKIIITVELKEKLSNAYYMLGKVFKDNHLAVRAEFALTVS